MNPSTSTENYRIEPAMPEDLPGILDIYQQAIGYQQRRGVIGWERIDAAFIEKDCAEGLLYKVGSEEAIAAVFCICYSDARIWRAREQGDALYIHRVAVDDRFRGARWFEKILRWSECHARAHHRPRIRIDTWANNRQLINYYRGYGFELVEEFTTGDDPDLPAQHRNLHAALLEYRYETLFSKHESR